MFQVVAEGVSQIARCGVVVIGVVMATEWGLLVFCVGQVCPLDAYRDTNIPPPSPAGLLLVLLVHLLRLLHSPHLHFPPSLSPHLHHSPHPPFPWIQWSNLSRVYPNTSCTVSSPQKWFRYGAVTLSWSFFKQSFLKQLLTDG